MAAPWPPEPFEAPEYITGANTIVRLRECVVRIVDLLTYHPTAKKRYVVFLHDRSNTHEYGFKSGRTTRSAEFDTLVEVRCFIETLAEKEEHRHAHPTGHHP